MSDSDKIFYCKLCEQTWNQLPEGTVRLTHRSGRGHVNTYRFADGTIHVITKTMVQGTKGVTK